MKTFITLILLLSVLAIAHGCVPRRGLYQWFNVGNKYYTFTKRNIRWYNADSACRNILPGRSQLANVRSDYEWRGLKNTVPQNWYWFNNKAVTNIENNVRYFHFDQRTRVYRQVRRDTNCLVYVYPGDGTTDMYCGVNWARGLCEVRC